MRKLKVELGEIAAAGEGLEKSLGLMLLCSLVPAGIYLCLSEILKTKFNTPSLSLHLLCLLIFAIGLMFSTVLSGRFRAGRHAITLAWRIFYSLSLVSISALYVLDSISNYFWGENVTKSLFFEYFWSASDLASIVPLSGLYVSVVVFVLLSLSFYLAWRVSCFVLRRSVYDWGLEAVGFGRVAYILAWLLPPIFIFVFMGRNQNIVVLSIAHLTAFSIFSAFAYTKYRIIISEFARLGGARTSSAGLLFLIFVLAIFGLVQAVKEAKHRDLAKEPFLSFFLEYQSVGGSVSPRQKKLQLQDEIERRKYQNLVVDQKKNVVLIVADALSASNTSIYGYGRETTPSLGRLVNEGNMELVDTAVASCSSSYCGILSILSSKIPRDISRENFLVHHLLHGAGYKSNFVLSGSHANYYGLKDAYGGYIDYYYEAGLAGSIKNDDEGVIAGLQKMPESDGRSNFFYIHLMSTHLSGIRRKEYQTYAPFRLGDGDNTVFDREAVYRNRYDNAVLQVDGYINRVIQTLESKGYVEEDTLVIVTSDHGESLGVRMPLGHGWDVSQQLIRIPLGLMGDRKLKNTKFAAHIDIAPTIADYLGIPIPSTWQGVSLFDDFTERYTYHETVKNERMKSVIKWTESSAMKYSIDDSGDETLFEIMSDPDEVRNLLDAADEKQVEELRRILEKYAEKT